MRNGKNHVQKLTAFLLSLCLLIGCFAEGGSIQARAAEVPVPEKEALCSDAYYTKIQNNAAWEAGEAVDACPDIVVPLQEGKLELVFNRAKSYLPYLKSGSRSFSLPELFPRSGDGTGEMPDRINRYASVKMVENTAARTVVLWRYAPQFPKDANINLVPFDGFVDEYFVIYPDGMVYRTARKGTPNVDDFYAESNLIRKSYRMTAEGVQENELSEPMAAVGTGYTDVASTDGTVTVSSVRSGAPETLELTVSAGTSSALIVERWGKADVASIQKNGTPLAAHTDYETGHVVEFDSERLVIWFAEPLQMGDELTVVPGSFTMPANRPAVVDAGADQSIIAETFPVTISLKGGVEDDGINPVTLQWTVTDGEGRNVNINAADQLETSAVVSAAGAYDITLTVNDGTPISDTMHVLIREPLKPMGTPKVNFTFNDGTGSATKEEVTEMECEITGDKPYWRAGIAGTALELNGYSSSVVLPAEKAPAIQDQLTVEAWTAVSAFPWSWAPIVHHSTWERKNPNDLTNPNNYRLTKGYYLGVNSHLQAGMMIMTENAGLQELLVPENTMTYSRWTYLVGTYDGQSMKIYIDGELAASKDVPNGGAIVLPENQDLIVGKGIPMVPTECFAKRFETDFGYEGAVDEVRVYDQTMDAEIISMQYRLDKPSNHLIRCPDLADRHLPKVATGKADSFGAVSTTLEHSECWDGRWRLSDDADIVVQFEDTPMKLVFWHGDGYIPCQVTENGIWYTNEFNETWNDEGCNEPMSDKHCRFNQARIIENTDSRVVVHWRYPLMSSKQNFTGRNNDGYWVDEYYYCYPDGTIIRRDKLQADAYKNVAKLNDFEWQETIVINDAYTYAGENVNKRNAYSVGTLRQGKPQSIQIANTTSGLKPYIIVQPDGCTIEPWKIDQWNHWPVSDVICDARPIKSPERISHTTLSSVKWNSFFELNPTEHYGIKISMAGLTDQTPDKLIPLGRSWLYPAETAIDNGTIRYAMDQKAFIAEEFTTEKLQISFHANQDTPLMNPTVILSNWTYGTDPVIRVNGNQLEEGKDYRLSAVTNRSGEKDLILWLNFKSEAFTLLTINCNEPSGTFPVLVKAETGGTITTDPAGKEIKAGENLKITFQPDEGYEVLSADINGELVNLDENGEYVIENVQEMVMVHAVFRRIGTAPKMLIHYTMEDNVEDVSGQNNNGTATDLTYVEGKAGKAAVFNGDSSKIGLPDLNDLPVFTVAAWVMPNRAKPQFQAILSSSAEWSEPGTLQFVYRGDTKQYIFSVSGNKGGSPLPEDMVAGSTSEINEWTHVAVSYDAVAKLGKLYINGELSTITNFTEAVPVNGNNLVIGEWGVYLNDPRILKGMIDDMRLYSGILTDEEIAELVVGKEKPEPPVPAEKPAVLEARWTMDQEEDGKIKDVSGNGHDATAHDLALVPGIEGKAAASFNGATTYLETGIDGEFEDISVSLWVRPKQFPASRQFATMLGTTAWENKDLQFTYNADGLVQFAVNGNDGGWPATTDLAPARRIRTGEWVHLAFVYDSSNGTAQAYINGKLEKEQTFTSAVPINMGKFNIGKWGTIEPRFMNGELDDIHIYRGLLTAEEIQDIVKTKVYPITLHAGGTKTDVPVEAVCGSEVAIVVSEIPSGKMIASVKAVGDGQELPLKANGSTYTFTMPNAPVDVTISIKPFDKAELSNLLDYASRLTQDDVGAENWNKLQKEIRAGRNVLWDSEATMHEISQSINALEAIVGKVYTLTVTGGTGSGVYAANDSVTVEPESREGWHFKEWSAENLSLTEEQTAAEELTFEMPQNDVSLTAHFEELSEVSAKTATCTVDGYEKHWKCSTCGKLFRDAEGKTETTLEELTIHAQGHKWSEWRVVEEATENKQGLEERTCSECEESETRVIPELEPSRPTPTPHPVHPVQPEKPETPVQLPFLDVAQDQWYYDSVCRAWEENLIDGMTVNTFEPDGTLTVAQAIKLAAVLYQRDNTGSVTLRNGTDVWFSTYVDYAITNGIIDKSYGDRAGVQMNKAITRSEFVKIFHGAMEHYSVINEVADNAIPDVKMNAENAKEIYEFYRAGILTGSDERGTFYPGSNIKRSEVATILLRMFDSNTRQEITLK